LAFNVYDHAITNDIKFKICISFFFLQLCCWLL